MADTITVTSAARGVRAVHVGGRIFPLGTPVSNVAQKTIDALEAMPGVVVDVAGKPDADPPEPTTTE